MFLSVCGCSWEAALAGLEKPTVELCYSWPILGQCVTLFRVSNLSQLWQPSCSFWISRCLYPRVALPRWFYYQSGQRFRNQRSLDRLQIRKRKRVSWMNSLLFQAYLRYFNGLYPLWSNDVLFSWDFTGEMKTNLQRSLGEFNLGNLFYIPYLWNRCAVPYSLDFSLWILINTADSPLEIFSKLLFLKSHRIILWEWSWISNKDFICIWKKGGKPIWFVSLVKRPLNWS